MKVFEHQYGRFTKSGSRYNIYREQGDTQTESEYAAQNGYTELPVADVELERAQFVRKRQIAAARYKQEMAGFQLPPEQGGMFVRTDARNRTLLNAAALRASADPAYEVPNWKTAEGTFITLSNAMILHLNGAVEQFIAARFAKEAALSSQIDAATTAEEVSAITWT